MLPNLDAKFSILPYKFTDDGPHKNKARLFFCMGLLFNKKYEPHVATDYYTDDLSEEDVKTFLNLFKIESNTKNPLDALQLYLQKYPSLKKKVEWEELGKDIDFFEDTQHMRIHILQFEIAKLIQHRTTFGIMATNGAHRIAWSIYYGKNWATTYDTWYVDSKEKLYRNKSDKMKVPHTSILFQPVTANIHYPEENAWTKDIINDLFTYSKSEDRQGVLAITRNWKNSVFAAFIH
jgi:hypothetical protein